MSEIPFQKIESDSGKPVIVSVDDNAMFPPSVWAEIPSNSRWTKGPEAFHSHYNEQFCIKIRSTSSEAVRSRHDSEKENFAMEKYQKLLRGEISRKQYVCILSYKYQPLV